MPHPSARLQTKVGMVGSVMVGAASPLAWATSVTAP
jgi:hypothetical protein